MTAPIVPDPTPAAAQPAPDDNELCGLTVAELREHTAETAALMKRNRELLADNARLQARAEAAERALRDLSGDMREVDWQFVPNDIIERVNEVLGKHKHNRNVNAAAGSAGEGA